MCEFEFSVREDGHETYSVNINIRISKDPDDDKNINDFMDPVIYGSDIEWEL